jgi:hypothetical protein
MGGLHANDLGIFVALKILLCSNLGSLCKLALLRILFFIPIFILTLIKVILNIILAFIILKIC